MNIEYREIPGFPGYRVGNDGSVWSRVRKGRRYKYQEHIPLYTDNWKQLSTPICPSNGYPTIALRQNGKVKTFLVHRLVLELFVGIYPVGMEARHYPDNNRTNCKLSNLSWASPLTNTKDKVEHGTQTYGENHVGAKLTNEDIPKIKKRYSIDKAHIEQIAIEFGVAPMTIKDIIDNKTWRHLFVR